MMTPRLEHEEKVEPSSIVCIADGQGHTMEQMQAEVARLLVHGLPSLDNVWSRLAGIKRAMRLFKDRFPKANSSIWRMSRKSFSKAHGFQSKFRYVDQAAGELIIVNGGRLSRQEMDDFLTEELRAEYIMMKAQMNGLVRDQFEAVKRYEKAKMALGLCPT